MSEGELLQFDGYYVSVWTGAESFVFREGIAKMDNYLRFYPDSEVIAASKKPLSNEELKNWITTSFSRWTEEDFKKNEKPPYYNVNDDPDHPYIITKYSLDKKGHLKFTFKTFREDKYVYWEYEGIIEGNTLDLMVKGTGGERHREKFKFIPLADIQYTSRKESNLYRNFIMHHFMSQFGGKPHKFQAELDLGVNYSQNELFYIPPSSIHPYYVVFTCGMGKNGMEVKLPELKYAELCIFLPRDWKINEYIKWDLIAQEPFKLLLKLSRYPFKYRTYFSNGHTILTGDMTRGVNFIGEMTYQFSSDYGLSKGINSIIIDDRRINVYGVVPLFREEFDFACAVSSLELMDMFKKKEINPFIFNPERINLCWGRTIDKTRVGDKIDTILKTYAMHPQTLEQWHELLEFLMYRNEWGNAWVAVIQAEEKFPEDYLLYYKKAIIASTSGLANIAVVEQSLEECVFQNPKFAQGWFLLGNVYVEKKNWEKAIEVYTNCIQLEPDNHATWKAYSVPHINTGRYARALEILTKAKELNPSDSEIDETIRDIEAKLGML